MPRFKLSHPDEVDAIQVTGDNSEPEQWLVRDSRGWISVMDNDAFHAMYEPTETPA